ncbi:hypothetical protein [Rhodococcus sp. T7]|nr:hypothetical protein [Rhodococcus sp. T7]
MQQTQKLPRRLDVHISCGVVGQELRRVLGKPGPGVLAERLVDVIVIKHV